MLMEAGVSSRKEDRKQDGPRFEKLENRLLLSLLGMGDQLGLPEASYDTTGTLTYAPQADTFDVDAAPLSLVLVQGQRPLRILDPRDFQMHMQIGDNGQLLGGVAGNDLYLQGKVMSGTTVLYDGVLLTGEVVAYGELDAATGSGADKFDFRFTPTGGLLMSYFQGYDIGVDLTLSYWSTSTPYAGSFATAFSGHAQGVLGVVPKLPPPVSSISGSVLADGSQGLAGVGVNLAGTDSAGQAVNLSAVTNDQGQWSFANLIAGTYSVSAAQPANYLDGDETAGSLGGTVANDLISQIVIPAGQNATGYIFNELTPSSLSGAVAHEGIGIGGVGITLTGTDDRGAAVSLTATTGNDGTYAFSNLRPGTYAVAEAQPAAYLDGNDAVGSLGGTVGNDLLSGIALASAQQGTGYIFNELTPSSLSGAVTVGTLGIGGVAITLTGTDDRGAAVELQTTTATNGSYSFENLRPGTYAVAEAQPANYLDGDDAAGSLGGTAGNDLITNIAIASAQQGTAYKFTEIVPGSLSGFAYVDFNNDGEIDFNEKAIGGVTVTLTGTDDRGQTVQMTDVTDGDGVYFFADLRPGTYVITESQPAGFSDGVDTLGTAGGTVTNDTFSAVALTAGVDGLNYNFGERPVAGAAVAHGQTATIGFWQNKNGQALLNALNGSASAKQLGNWLAATFSSTFGNLAGKTNAQVAQIYVDAFKAKKGKQDIGPAKLDCQVMATAFAVYVTNSSLAGTAATKYGFLVTATGVGTATFNIGSNGAAFNVANNTVMTVLDLLLATESHTAYSGVLYSYNIVNPDGTISYGIDAVLRAMANEVYTRINESGDIA